MNETRLREDHRKLTALAQRSAGAVRVDRVTGSPPNDFHLQLSCRGLQEVRDGVPIFRERHSVRIHLGGDYPLMEPRVEFKTPILHPHVWAHDLHVCLGGWTPTEYLDLLVGRMFRLIQLDPAFINAHSIANHTAWTWVKANLRSLPLGTVDPSSPAPAAKPRIRFIPS